MPAPTLEFLDGARPPVELDELLVVGRGEGCSVRIDQPAVAEQHLRLTRDLVGVVWAEALAPGVKRAGKPLVIREPLADGDELEVGGVKLRFRSGGDAEERTELTTLPTTLTALDAEEEDPSTTQMDPAEIERLRPAEPKMTALPIPDGPAPLPPPPVGQPLATNPAIPLPPPPPPTSDAFAKTMSPEDALLGTGSRELTRPSLAAGYIELSEVSAVTITETQPEAEPPTRQIELPASARNDPTTQPSLRAVALPPRAGNVRRAVVFAQALWEGPTRPVLVADLVWSVAAGGALGAAVLLGAIGPAIVIAGLALIAAATLVSAARVAELVSPEVSLALTRPDVPGLDPSLVGVARLRIALLVIAAFGAGLSFTGLGGAILGAMLAAAALATQAWLRAAYSACLSAWARACPADQPADPHHAPDPLKRALNS